MPSKPVLGFSLLGTKRTTGRPASLTRSPGPGFPLHGRHHSRREGDFILRRMRRVLGEFGSDLSHAVRLDQYYPVPRAVASYHLARHAEFGDYIPASTSVVMERCCVTARPLRVARSGSPACRPAAPGCSRLTGGSDAGYILSAGRSPKPSRWRHGKFYAAGYRSMAGADCGSRHHQEQRCRSEPPFVEGLQRLLFCEQPGGMLLSPDRRSSSAGEVNKGAGIDLCHAQP